MAATVPEVAGADPESAATVAESAGTIAEVAGAVPELAGTDFSHCLSGHFSKEPAFSFEKQTRAVIGVAPRLSEAEELRVAR